MTRTQALFRSTTLVTLVADSLGGMAYVSRHDTAPVVTSATTTRGDGSALDGRDRDGEAGGLGHA